MHPDTGAAVYVTGVLPAELDHAHLAIDQPPFPGLRQRPRTLRRWVTMKHSSTRSRPIPTVRSAKVVSL